METVGSVAPLHERRRSAGLQGGRCCNKIRQIAETKLRHPPLVVPLAKRILGSAPSQMLQHPPSDCRCRALVCQK